jgi:putative Mg2+ transporter-C (MgtC) family protein
MNWNLAQLVQPISFSWVQQLDVANGAVSRLLAACALGGAVGLERELNGKASGVRTNLLIAMGSAFFTLLSPVLAGEAGTNRGQVASNIVQGIGFLGAGVILHNRSRVSGLTSAAAIFAVASIGMACGAGEYAAAVAGAAMVIAALEVVGFLERRANLKQFSLIYEVRGIDQTQMMECILDAMDKAGERLAGIEQDAIGAVQRVSFTLWTTTKKHAKLQQQLEAEPSISALHTFRDPEDD